MRAAPTIADGTDAIIFGIRAHADHPRPVRPSRENVISIPSVRRNICARRSRLARVRGFFAHPLPTEMASPPSEHNSKRSDALPVHMVRLAMIARMFGFDDVVDRPLRFAA